MTRGLSLVTRKKTVGAVHLAAVAQFPCSVCSVVKRIWVDDHSPLPPLLRAFGCFAFCLLTFSFCLFPFALFLLSHCVCFLQSFRRPFVREVQTGEFAEELDRLAIVGAGCFGFVVVITQIVLSCRRRRSWRTISSSACPRRRLCNPTCRGRICRGCGRSAGACRRGARGGSCSACCSSRGRRSCPPAAS